MATSCQKQRGLLLTKLMITRKLGDFNTPLTIQEPLYERTNKHYTNLKTITIMKRNEKKRFLIIGSFFTILVLNAQEQTLDCNYNIQEALFHLKGSNTIEKDNLKAVEFLKPCLEAQSANAQLIMGHLYLNSSQDEEDIQKGFQLIKKAAKQKHPVALENLGVLYKYGRGCKLNYNKARRAFKKASKLGNHKATYSLGYLYLKGLGNTKQDYKKAVKWFEKSEYPMANHWLGICYLKGYGVPKNITRANDLLKTNFEDQPTTESVNSVVETHSENAVSPLETTEGAPVSNTITKDNIYGKWNGKLLQFDWSGTSIEQSIPLELEFKYDSINNNIQYKWKANSEEEIGTTSLIDDAIYFENLQITLPHRSYHVEEQNTLEHEFLSSELSLKNIAGTHYLIGEIESYIPEWNEPSTPMRFVLTKESVTTENNIEISEAVLQALATQKNSFIKLYPNPFESDLIVAYTLKEASHIQIKLMSILDMTQAHTIEQGKQQQAGDYRYHFDGSALKKGLYVVSVYVNGVKKTKLIIKK